MAVSRTALLVLFTSGACLAQGGACSDLRSLVKSTYKFKPSKLTDAQRKNKSAEMDKVWNLVEAHPAEMLPCLIAEMEAPAVDTWFLFGPGGPRHFRGSVALAPALLKIATDPAHPEPELALSVMSELATLEADNAFRSVDLTGLPSEVQSAARTAIANRPIFEPRQPLKSTRAEILSVFRSPANQRDFRPFLELVVRVSDGERDVVTVMTPEDLPFNPKSASCDGCLGESAPDGRLSVLTGIICTLQGTRR